MSRIPTGVVRSVDELIGMKRSTASLRLKQSLWSMKGVEKPAPKKNLREEWERYLRENLGIELVKLGRELLNQQMWLWGRDVSESERNLLLRYGFTRHGIPHGRMGCSCYSLTTGKGRSIALWGFGMFFGCPNSGGIYLRRYEFLPQLANSHRLTKIGWCEHEIIDFRTPEGESEFAQGLHLLAECCRWIGKYEEWVLRVAGSVARQRGVASWQNPTCPAAEIAQRWKELENACRVRCR